MNGAEPGRFCAKLVGLLLFMSGCEEAQGGKHVESAPAERSAERAPLLSVSGSVEVVREGSSRRIELAKLLEEIPPRLVETQDPYYKKRKKFWALPLSKFVESVFETASPGLDKKQLELQASDGYRVRLPGHLLVSEAAFFAVADADSPGFEPIGDQKAHPGPLYLIWKGDGFANEKEYPRPWAVVKMTLLEESAAWHHLKPKDGFGKDTLAARGFSLFEKECIRCHSINQDGGKVGPDLNVPKNILTYRPETQVRAYIVDPRTFRYSTMPAHPDLSDTDLDALIAYFRVMGDHQFDPQSSSVSNGASP